MDPLPANTTAALLTAGGRGGIAVIALRGPDARRIIASVFTPRDPSVVVAPEPGRLWLGRLADGDQPLDEAILSLRGDRATTYAAEINIHGGPRVCQRVLAVLSREGADIVEADPAADGLWPLAADGLDNPAIGRELLHHLPSAPTDAVVTLLSRQWSAGLSRLAHDAIATLEANAAADAADLAASLTAAADRFDIVNRLLNPPELVLAGPPNVGKSTLANALLGREACIVTDMAGTTRDWVRELADLGGPAVWLTDTAGLWAAADPLDHESIRRAWQRVDAADLVLAVFDAAAPPAATDAHWRRLLAEPHVLPVANKADRPSPPSEGCIRIAAETGQGLPDLRAAIAARLGLTDLAPDLPAAFTDRQQRLSRQAASALAAHSHPAALAALTDLLGRD